jgi:hypothetical protein
VCDAQGFLQSTQESEAMATNLSHLAPAFPREAAKQQWEVGQVVNVGFVKGLVVQGRNADGSYALWQPSSFRRYEFTPHLGLYRVEGVA